MKNVQKATKIPVEPRSDLSATLQAMRSWKCFVPVSGLESSYGKNSKNFQLGYRDLGYRAWGPFLESPDNLPGPINIF